MSDTPQRTVGTYEAVLSSELDDSGPYTIHGVALGEGDTTVGHLSETKKVWPGDELQQAAESLEGTPLVKDHENNVDGLIGEVVAADYKDGVGVIYEAEVDEQYRSIARKIANGRLDVSPRIKHAPESELEENGDGALVVEDMRFVNLSVVNQGASPSNSVQVGDHAELTAAELAAAFADDGATEEILADPGAEFDDTNASLGAGDLESVSGADVTELDEMQIGTVTFDDVGDGTVDEEDIPSEHYERHYVVAGDSKDASMLPVVDDRGTLRSGSVEDAWMDRDDIDTDLSMEELEQRLYALAAQFALSPVSPFDGEVVGPEYYFERREEAFEDDGVAGAVRDYMATVDTTEETVADELATYEYHDVSYDDTTTGDWSDPTLSEFVAELDDVEADAIDEFQDLDADHRRTIEEHFFLGEGGFPVENYGQLHLGAVEPNGDLSLSALATIKGGHGAQAVSDLDAETVDRVTARVNELAAEAFDRSWGPTDAEELVAQEEPILTVGDGVKIETDISDQVAGYTADQLPDEPYGRIEELYVVDETTMLRIELYRRMREDDGLMRTNQTVTVEQSDVVPMEGTEHLQAWGRSGERFVVDDVTLVDLEAGDIVDYDGDAYEVASLEPDVQADPHTVALHRVDQPVPVTALTLADDDATLREDVADSEPTDQDESAAGPTLAETISVYNASDTDG